MLNDLDAGNRLEAPWLSGAVARMAREAGGIGARQRDALRGGQAVLHWAAAVRRPRRTTIMRLLLVWLINAAALFLLQVRVSVGDASTRSRAALIAALVPRAHQHADPAAARAR